MSIDRSRKRAKAQWARALEIPMRERLDGAWGMTECEGTAPSIIAADDYETPRRRAQRIEETIENAFAAQEMCVNCGGSGTVWHRDVESGGRYQYTTIGMAFYDCIVCNPGVLE